MKIYYKNKILINGLFPLINYIIDGYTEKTGKMDEKKINVKDEDYLFYTGGYLINSSYAVEEKEGIYYEYFENDELFEIEVSDDIYKDKYKLSKYLLQEIDTKVRLLERKIRLITNLRISLPIFRATIFDENKEYITSVGLIANEISHFSISSYDEKLKEILTTRLNMRISNDTLLNLENKNNRYKRAFRFYNSSFVPDDCDIRFTLLFSSLESLFNLNGKHVKNTIAEYSSKILFLSSEDELETNNRLLDFYKKRSEFIHGNNPPQITFEEEFELREIVRKVLLIYWHISTCQGIYNPALIKKYLDITNQDNLELQTQLFIKYFDVKDYKKMYLKIKEDLLNGKNTLLA